MKNAKKILKVVATMPGDRLELDSWFQPRPPARKGPGILNICVMSKRVNGVWIAINRNGERMKDVLVLISPILGDQLSAAARYALALAATHGAHLSVLIAEIEAYPPDLPPDSNISQVGAAISRPKQPSDRLTRAATLVLSAAERANVQCEILEPEGEAVSLREHLIDCAKVRDVLVIDVFGLLKPPRKELIDGALFGSGRPVILVPASVRTFSENRIVVAWDATRSAVRAVHDALPILARSSDVSIVSVIDDKDFSRLDSGHALCDYLARWNVNAKVYTIDRADMNVGVALLSYAQQAGADLLVMGGFAHGFERTLMLGSATQDILRANLERPVFMSH